MYAKHGLEVDLISREPDDHLAYELMFLGHLLARELVSLNKVSLEKCAKLS